MPTSFAMLNDFVVHEPCSLPLARRRSEFTIIPTSSGARIVSHSVNRSSNRTPLHAKRGLVRNPRTSESIAIAASRVPSFKTAKGLRDAVG